MMDKAGLYMFVPSFSRNQTGALQYLNWLAKYENYHYLQVGELGRNHTLINGVPNVAGRPEGDPCRMNSGNNIDYTMPLNGVQMGDQDLNSRVLALSYGAIPPQRIVDAYAISIKGARAAVVYPVPTTVNQYADTLQTKSRALLAQSITARTTDFDRVYDAGMADWMASGAQEMLDERSRLWPVGQP
jgi:putative aldouronate transport system substrate-binding protein